MSKKQRYYIVVEALGLGKEEAKSDIYDDIERAKEGARLASIASPSRLVYVVELGDTVRRYVNGGQG